MINMDTVVVDLNCQAIFGMDILGDTTKLPFILDLVDGTLSGGGYETIQLHRFHAVTECFTETTDTVCIPPHSEVIARVEEIQAIQHIGTRETERSAGECALPPHLIDVLNAASEFMSDQRARS